MQGVAADHERAVQRLKADMAAAAAAGADDKLQDPAAITESQLLKWDGSFDGSSAATAAVMDNPAAAAAAGLDAIGAAAAGSSGLAAAMAGSRHLVELAPLSGLQPPPPRSRIVQNTQCTAGEVLYLRSAGGGMQEIARRTK